LFSTGQGRGRRATITMHGIVRETIYIIIVVVVVTYDTLDASTGSLSIKQAMILRWQYYIISCTHDRGVLLCAPCVRFLPVFYYFFSFLRSRRDAVFSSYNVNILSETRKRYYTTLCPSRGSRSFVPVGSRIRDVNHYEQRRVGVLSVKKSTREYFSNIQWQ